MDKISLIISHQRNHEIPSEIVEAVEEIFGHVEKIRDPGLRGLQARATMKQLVDLAKVFSKRAEYLCLDYVSEDCLTASFGYSDEIY